MQLCLPLEMPDLRKSPLADLRTTRPPYVRKSPPRMVTAELPIGTQADFIAAAAKAAALGKPLNVLLTIRWRSLFCDNDVNPLRILPTAERIHHIVEHLRKWLQRNGAAACYIWVRENADNAGEHFHVAFHVPRQRQKNIAHYVARLTGEAMQRRGQVCATEGEFARGELGSWHLSRDTRPDRCGYYLAAYLGKGEPSQRRFRGGLVDNKKKPVRGTSFGGTYKDGKYDITQGLIEGTTARFNRFFIANDLKREAGLSPTKKAAVRPAALPQFIANPTFPLR